MQYGIRLSTQDIAFGEFLRLLAGIMPDTPLGHVVQIRTEKNQEVLKRFGVNEKRIRADWTAFCAGRSKSEFGDLKELQGELAKAFAINN